MNRATICIATDFSEEDEIFQAWSNQWKDKMDFFSEDYGCGCCVSLYDVSGPKEAIDAIPEKIKSTSNWTQKGVR